MLVCPESISGLSPYPVDVFQFFHTWSPPGLFLVFLTSSFRLVSIFMANLGMEVECILQTCPIHCHVLLLITWNRGMMLILLYSYSFEMAIDQKMRNILQRHRIWKVSILFELTLDTFFPSSGLQANYAWISWFWCLRWSLLISRSVAVQHMLLLF